MSQHSDGLLQEIIDAVLSGSGGGGTQYTEGATDATLTGPVVLAEGPANTATPLQLDVDGNLKVVTSTTPSGTFQTENQLDYDTGAGTDTQSIIGIALPASGGAVAGGTTGTGIKVSSTANLGVFFGLGVPTLSAAQGSLYVRTDGSSTSTRLYVNSNGTTGWVAVTTAS